MHDAHVLSYTVQQLKLCNMYNILLAQSISIDYASDMLYISRKHNIRYVDAYTQDAHGQLKSTITVVKQTSQQQKVSTLKVFLLPMYMCMRTCWR